MPKVPVETLCETKLWPCLGGFLIGEFSVKVYMSIYILVEHID